MAGVPHFGFPMQITASGQFATVEQDSDQDLAACITLLLAYPQGSRPDVPAFGVPEQLFLQGGPHTQEIRTAVEDYEPRVLTAPQSVLEDAAATVDLYWKQANA